MAAGRRYGADYQACRSGSMSGKALMDKYWVLLNGGRQAQPVVGRPGSPGRVPSGLYLFRVTAGGRSFGGKVVITR